MKEHMVQIDLNKLNNDELDMMIDYFYKRDMNIVGEIMDLKAWRNEFMNEKQSKAYAEKYIYD